MEDLNHHLQMLHEDDEDHILSTMRRMTKRRIRMMARDEDNPGDNEDECPVSFLWSTGNIEETRDPGPAEEEDTRDEDWEVRTPHPLINEDDIQNSDDSDIGSEEEENNDSDSENEEEENGEIY